MSNADVTVSDIAPYSEGANETEQSKFSILRVTKIQSGLDKHAYKTQNNCLICNVSLGKGGSVYMQKHTW